MASSRQKGTVRAELEESLWRFGQLFAELQILEFFEMKTIKFVS